MTRSRARVETEVAHCWLTHHSVEEVDWAGPRVRLEFDPGVERPTQPVTFCLPRRLVRPKDRDVPYRRNVG